MAATWSSLCDDVLTEILKRVPEKSLLRSKCVQKSWYHLIKSPRFISIHSKYHKNSNIYMLVRLEGDCGDDLVLYRMDSRHTLQYTSDSKHVHDLRPLLVFPRSSKLGYGVSCIKFGSKLYFFGLDYFFGRYNSCYWEYGPIRVHIIEEEELMDLEPSEENYFFKFRHLFPKTKTPMHSYKYSPLCFVANNKLYALSRCCTDIPFEVFCPVDGTWEVLPSPYDVKEDFDFNKVSHIVSEKEHMVYFATCNAMMSFNLETRDWTHTFAHSDQDQSSFQQATRVGELGLGFVDDPIVMDHVCASKPLSRGEEVMQPYLAPDLEFLKALSSSRFTYVYQLCCTGYIVALQDSDNKEVVCFVTYGSKVLEYTNDGDRIDTKSSYVALSFFRIPGDFYTSENRFDIAPCNDGSYADEKVEDGGVIRRYFNAKYQYTKHFLVSNSQLFAKGEIESCFA